MGGSTDPDGDRGFGRIHLESALPFDGEGVWALYVEDADGSTTSAGMVSLFCHPCFVLVLMCRAVWGSRPSRPPRRSSCPVQACPNCLNGFCKCLLFGNMRRLAMGVCFPCFSKDVSESYLYVCGGIASWHVSVFRRLVWKRLRFGSVSFFF